MTQEDKELLLKDISGRLPYGQIVQISLFRNDGRKRDIDLDPHVTENIWEIIDKYHALPYLRPMSSMTDEERKEVNNLIKDNRPIPYGKINNKGMDNLFSSVAVTSSILIDWLNAHHFDYRGLIERGLAISLNKEINKENFLYENVIIKPWEWDSEKGCYPSCQIDYTENNKNI